MNVQEFLKANGAEYSVLPHADSFSAQRLAHALHVPGQLVAKTVLLRADGGYAYIVAVLPATAQIDLQEVSRALGGSRIELANEMEIHDLCPDCEFGALPPFGSQYHMKTLVEESLTQDERIVFEGNTHHEAIEMPYAEYRRIEQPVVAKFARHSPGK